MKWATQVDLYRCLVKGRSYLSVHFAEPNCLAMAAEHAGISPYHFTRLFTKLFGERPVQYRTRLRLQASKSLLAGTGKSAQEICTEIGFDSPTSFSSLFRRRFGVSPSKYRAILAEKNKVRREAAG